MRSFFAGSAALLWAAVPALAQGEPPKPAQIVINDSGGAMQGAMKKAFYDECAPWFRARTLNGP